MKLLFFCFFAIGCLVAIPALLAFKSGRDDTVIYLTRHAEKDLSDPKNRNPALTAVGEERAKHLAEKLQNAGITAIYTTNFIRTVGTVTPLATQLDLPVQYYSGVDYPAILAMFNKEKGKTILVCGHSDNLLPIIQKAGAKPPIDAIADQDYDNLFRLIIHADGTADATVEHYK